MMYLYYFVQEKSVKSTKNWVNFKHFMVNLANLYPITDENFAKKTQKQAILFQILSKLTILGDFSHEQNNYSPNFAKNFAKIAISYIVRE